MTNGLTVVLAAISFFTYLFVYTPLKTRTWLCTLVGAVPGALPPLIGWTARAGSLSPEAWSLFSVMFFWQMPHFYSLAWMYRKEFENAGMKILSVVDPSGIRLARQILFFSGCLAVASVTPFFLGLCGRFYLITACISSAFFFALSLKTARDLEGQAKKLFRASLLYLSVILVVIMGNRI